MAEVVPPRQPLSSAPIEQAASIIGVPMAPSTLREPNPHFVFPMQSGPGQAPVSLSGKRLSNDNGLRNSIDRVRPQRLSIGALPGFDFNPSGSSDDVSNSPSRSISATTSPYLNASTSGHRRNGSEFIGGDGKHGPVGIMNPNSTKEESALHPPTANLSASASGKRGHAHRRSGAVSNHDLSDILELSLEPRGSSLSTTPSHSKDKPGDLTYLGRSSSQPEVNSSANTLPFPSVGDNSLVSVQPRVRVGFSDTVEFIPRPVSTISSDTSSSLSTIRASHSLTGSITSIVSSEALSHLHGCVRSSSTDGLVDQGDLHAGKEPVKPNLMDVSPSSVASKVSLLHQWSSPAAGPNDQNPCTNGLVTPEYYADRPANSLDALIDRTKQRGTSSQDRSPEAFEPLHIKRPSIPLILSRPRSSPEPKISKKQRMVRSWAGSVLSRRTRPYSPTSDNFVTRSLTSPSRVFAPSLDLSAGDVNFDEDNTCVIRDPSHIPTMPRASVGTTSLRAGNTNSYHHETQTTILDLDAALGSDFNSVTDGGFPAARRRMHSSGATGGFIGPGMHYHRRAESAPEMAPIDYRTFDFSRFNTNPGMADVFEEEEEEEEDDAGDLRWGKDWVHEGATVRVRSEERVEGDTGIGLGVSVVDGGSLNNESSQTRKSPQRGGWLSERVERAVGTEDMQASTATPTFPDSSIVTQAPIEIVEADEEPRASLVAKPPQVLSATPPLMTGPLFARPVSVPTMNFPPPKASFPHTAPEILSSTVSSPDYTRTSFDVPRLHTANSSLTDRATLNSCRAGDHALSFHGSVDDVPSLTSSASTMTSAPPPRISSSAYTSSSTERSSSLSAAVPSLARPPAAGKRSSLASLSRLMGSAYGEKSKLIIEEHSFPEITDRVEKKKGNSISRLMRFWKSTDTYRS